jgi:vancomycin resistance protein YoaR
MESIRTLANLQSKVRIWATRAAQVSVMACAALFVSIFAFLFAVRLFYIGRALPGVHAAGINLGGMNQARIEAELKEILTYPQTGLIVLRDGEQVWTAHPAELGVVIDISGMAQRALNVGREGSLNDQFREQVEAWRESRKIPTIILFDHVVGEYFLGSISQQIELPTIEATLTIQDLEVIATPGQIGRQVNTQATLDALAELIVNFHDADLELLIQELPPIVLDATEQAQIATELLSQSFSLTAEGAEPTTFEPSELADMLRFEVVHEDSEAYSLILDGGEMTAVLDPLIPELDRNPENARYRFNDDTGELDLVAPAIIGRTLDVNATLESIYSEINLGKHEAPLAFVYKEPQIGNEATSEELGISEPVSVVSTYFSGSSSSRIQNIKTAASAFDGLLVAPGETLSMSEVLGDISLDSGYAEALIIFGDRTIKGVGGGVCQVSTTLFRAVFFGGYPIVERHPHAYRVGYYEIGSTSPGPGLDATVFVPVVDFKFTNDSEHWLLLETYIYNNNRLEWKFYSTLDGREVTWSRDISDEKDAPKDLYKLNEDLDKGEIKQIDWSADGMTVVVYRTVTRNGEVLYQDTIRTRYLPWQAIYEYGPGTKLPKDIIIDDEDD